MKTPESSSLFTPWRNPSNGVESWVLTRRLAPVQQAFYFTNPSFSENGRFLWVMCMHLPRKARKVVPVLGVVDFEEDELRVYPETQCGSARPMVDAKTGEIYWCNDFDLWKRGPKADDEPVWINRLPKDIAQGPPERLATHLTFSADRTSVNIDARFERDTFLGDLPLDGSPFRLWQKIDGASFDHGMFSPIDPGLMLVAHEYWQDHIAEPFEELRPYHRMWTIRRGGCVEPVLNQPVSHSGHEWWDADGKHVWYVHYGAGVKKVNLASRSEETLWPGALSHAHCDRAGRWLAADMMADPVVSDCHVAFRNLATGREVEIVNRPPLDVDVVQCGHLHPHPHFCLNDQYICYTTTVYGRVDLALTRTRDLVERTSVLSH